MSALGHKRTFAPQKAMSALLPIATAKADFRALPPKPDVCGTNRHVCFGPEADIALPYSTTSSARPSTEGGTGKPSGLAVLELLIKKKKRPPIGKPLVLIHVAQQTLIFSRM
jgi:hypothetical protein